MERNLIGEMNMMKESGAKPNFTDIARRYGVDRHTVARYWNGGGPQPLDGREGRASGFDRYRDEIERKAALPGMTKRALHEFLLDRHSGDEPPVPGYNAFTHYLRRNGVAVGRGLPEAHPRFETEPGRQLQFDWKEDIVMHDRSGAEYRFNVFSATLGFSRRHLLRRSPTRTRDDLLACMYDTAARLGGVPAEWLTDNMSAIAAVGGDGRRRRDPRVERFAREAGFEIVLCAPGTPETKGKVESANRFVSRLLAYEGDFDGWEGVDEAIARIERRSNEEPNGTTGLPPDLLFMREKDALRPLGNRALLESMNLPRFRLHPYAAFRAAPSRCLASNSAGLRFPSAEWILTLL